MVSVNLRLKGIRSKYESMIPNFNVNGDEDMLSLMEYGNTRGKRHLVKGIGLHLLMLRDSPVIETHLKNISCE